MSTAKPTINNTVLGPSPNAPNNQASHFLPLAPSITLSETFDEEDIATSKSSMSLLQHIHLNNYHSKLAAPQASVPNKCLTQKKQSKSVRTQSQPLPLLSLPIDALHKMSNFLDVKDWCSVSLASRAAHIICSDVFRRVRMHGFKCAAEVITSWEAGEHEDAKELVALYLHSGVPIYPARRRDVYHTIIERMKAETTEMTQPTETSSEDDDETINNGTQEGSSTNISSTSAINRESVNEHDDSSNGKSTKNGDKQTLDRFYSERKDARVSGGYYVSTLTYLEEKSLFWKEVSRAEEGGGGVLGSGSTRGINQLRNNPRHSVPQHATHSAAAREENLQYHFHHYQHLEDFGIFHDYNFHQIRTFGDPEASLVAAFDAVTPFRGHPVSAGGIDDQGRHQRALNANQHERRSRMVLDDASRNPLPRNGMELSSPLLSPDSSEIEINRRGSKMVLHCHKHLVDRHYLGRPAIFDDDGVMVAQPISLAADFFHPSTCGFRYNATFGFKGLSRRDNNGFRLATASTVGTSDSATTRTSRVDSTNQMQAQTPNMLHNQTTPLLISDENEQQTDPSPQNTEHSGETIYLTPTSSPKITTERNDSLTPPPPPDSTNDYSTSTAMASTSRLTPPPLLHSNLTPPPPLGASSYTEVSRLSNGMSQVPLPYDDMGHIEAMEDGKTGFSSATFPFVVELNVMNDIELKSYSSLYGPYQVYDEKQDNEEPQQLNHQMQGMTNRQNWGNMGWRKRARELIRRYELKLKSHLDKSFNIPLNNGGTHRNVINCCADHKSFNETLLDFWDEFFSLTANIHYFDTGSPIPRATRMSEFLSQPCSKALGTIQCEIQRTRTMKIPNGKKKGRGTMKEKLFPTYEYRLFLRDQRFVHRQQNGQVEAEGQDGRHQYQPPPAPHPPEVNDGGERPGLNENSDSDEQPSVRLDTILMAARFMGKKHGSQGCPSGRQGSSTQSKKGVNNYYLHLPQKHDIEQHFKAVNPHSIASQHYEHLLQKAPPTTGKELGRVQSNFIGTEFQIFSSKNDNRHCNKLNTSISSSGIMKIPSEGTAELDGGTNSFSGGYSRQSSDPSTVKNSSDSGAHQRRLLGRLRKSRLRGKKSSGGASHSNTPERDGNSNQPQQGTDNAESEIAPSPMRRLSKMKSSWLRSRRAIANSTTDASDCGSYQNMASHEVEIGAITYTANLLGNRPRIMDVCIPNVNSDKWKNYLENCCENYGTTESGVPNEEERSMLNKLKILQVVAEQQLVQNQIGGMLDADERNPTQTIDVTPDFGLLSLQNRPPWWNVELGAFVLNFGGRVSVASVKNFQLCDRHNHDESMLQFGRIEGRHSFTMDYSYPLSAVQAFAIAISSLQSKISFG